MQTFSDLMSAIRSVRARYAVLEATAPWGVESGDEETCALYFLTTGSCWLEAAGLDGPERIATGDVVLVPHGGRHVLRDAPASPVQAHAFAPPSTRVTLGGGGAPTTMICGGVVMAERDHAIFARLPPVVHLLGSDQALRSMSATMSLLAAEVAAGGPSAPTVINRLFDIVFVKVVFAYLAAQSASAEGWQGALRDRQVSDALAAIQKNPELPWTVGSLASLVKMSRSAFAARFNVLVGDTPLQYVTRARMQRAANILRGDDARLASIAAATGYESEAAFSKAFKRFMGMSPSEYRRAFRPG